MTSTKANFPGIIMHRRMKGTPAFAAVALACLYLGGCNTTPAAVQASGPAQDVANPSTPDAKFNTRSPRTCKQVTSTPTAAQIPALIQCGFEYETSSAIALMTDIKVQTGGFRAYSPTLDANASSIDTAAKVMPIRGSMVQWNCTTAKFNPGTNCSRINKTQAEGKCWKTTFGDWKCGMSDSYHIDGEYRIGPPTEQ
jgi:hypothetical protein